MPAPFTTNTIITPYDGITYSNAVPLTQQEADLSSIAGPGGPFDPLAVLYNQAAMATVLLQAVGNVPAQTCYVVMQTSNDQVNWIDLAWLVSTMTTGTQLYALCACCANAAVVQQTRAKGTAPGSNGSNVLPLGGSLRFIGATTLGSSSSPSAGFPMIQATIKVKLLGLR